MTDSDNCLRIAAAAGGPYNYQWFLMSIRAIFRGLKGKKPYGRHA